MRVSSQVQCPSAVKSDSSNPSVSISFAVFWDLRGLSMWSSPSSSDKHTMSSPCTAILTLSLELWNNAALCLPLRNPTNSPKIRVTWSSCQLWDRVLSSTHSLDLSANFVFAIFLTVLCWKSDVDESLDCSFEGCSADVMVSQLQWSSFVRPTDRYHD